MANSSTPAHSGNQSSHLPVHEQDKGTASNPSTSHLPVHEQDKGTASNPSNSSPWPWLRPARHYPLESILWPLPEMHGVVSKDGMGAAERQGLAQDKGDLEDLPDLVDLPDPQVPPELCAVVSASPAGCQHAVAARVDLKGLPETHGILSGDTTDTTKSRA
ncbi:unnamed protein product [Peniophora sp. CBMAI 1063]|nr:unnamed protein product [Peniophora sp. CBMAI 1063]